MSSLGLLKPGMYKQETKAGILGIEITEDNIIMMNKPVLVFSEIIDKEEIADSLHMKTSEMSEDLPIQIV